MVNGGRCPPVGTTGFILGGGLGPFTRTFGMACDSLIEAALVIADGEMVTVSDSDDLDSDNGKLFWLSVAPVAVTLMLWLKSRSKSIN
jgi:FAD/FMN-containing dehydrogenase